MGNGSTVAESESERTGGTTRPSSLFGKLLATQNDPAITVARVALGAVFFVHGAQKMPGWFGGYGFDATMGFFTQQMGIPAVLAFLAIAAEFFGGLGLMVGLLGRIAALGVLTNMIVAVALVHAKFGFFMNWSGSQQGEGFEYHVLAIALAAVIVFRGSGAWSVDALLSRKLSAPAQ